MAGKHQPPPITFCHEWPPCLRTENLQESPVYKASRPFLFQIDKDSCNIRGTTPTLYRTTRLGCRVRSAISPRMPHPRNVQLSYPVAIARSAAPRVVLDVPNVVDMQFGARARAAAKARWSREHFRRLADRRLLGFPAGQTASIQAQTPFHRSESARDLLFCCDACIISHPIAPV